MLYTELTKKALRVCFDAHKEQSDRGGAPYVFHPFHLAEQMTDELSTVTALLHDTVEDTDLTLEALSDMGFPREVTDALRLLTRTPGIPYTDYIRALKPNPIARAVKRADLAHNADLSRLPRVTDADLARAEKYRLAAEYLDAPDEPVQSSEPVQSDEPDDNDSPVSPADAEGTVRKET